MDSSSDVPEARKTGNFGKRQKSSLLNDIKNSRGDYDDEVDLSDEENENGDMMKHALMTTSQIKTDLE